MIKVGLVLASRGDMRAPVRDVARQLAEARRRATNAVVRQAPDHLRQRMRQVFDRPTPYALNAFRAQFANRNGSEAAIMIKGPADVTGSVPQQSVLRANILGGRRRLKQSERSLQASRLLPPGYFVVPGRSARVDTFGNITRGEILRILAYLRALVAERGGARPRRSALTDPRRERLRRGTRNRIGFRMFVVPVGDRGGLPPGVYEEQLASRRFTGPAGRPRQLLRFTRDVQYRRRFDFWGELQQHAAQAMPRELDRVLATMPGLQGGAR